MRSRVRQQPFSWDRHAYRHPAAFSQPPSSRAQGRGNGCQALSAPDRPRGVPAAGRLRREAVSHAASGEHAFGDHSVPLTGPAFPRHGAGWPGSVCSPILCRGSFSARIPCLPRPRSFVWIVDAERAVAASHPETLAPSPTEPAKERLHRPVQTGQRKACRQNGDISPVRSAATAIDDLVALSRRIASRRRPAPGTGELTSPPDGKARDGRVAPRRDSPTVHACADSSPQMTPLRRR